MADDPLDPLDRIETSAEFVGAELDEMTDDLAHAGRRLVSLLERDLLSRDGYLIVLIMVLLSVVVLAVDDAFRGGEVVSSAMLALLVLTTLSRSHVSHGLRVFGAAVTTSTVVAAIVGAILGRTPVTASGHPADTWAYGLAAATYTLLLAMLFPAILRQGFTHRTVNLNTVAASLSAYLLLGLIFAASYRFVEIVAPPMFNQSHVNSFTYIYFSYVTLTTVGFGDFTAHNDAGRALAILEALFGQVFLVTIVAMVVSNLGQERRVILRRPLENPRTATADDRAALARAVAAVTGPDDDLDHPDPPAGAPGTAPGDH